MKSQYQSNRWISFREELIELDGGRCVRCNKGRSDGVVLQVHHRRYLPGKAPWEYPFELCETLCKRCHAEEHGEIRPDSGWEFVGQDDLGGLYGTCDRCGTDIRHVFFVQHPSWGPMSVGTVCCDDLTGTTVATESRKLDERLERFLSSTRWREEDGRHLIKQKQIEVQILPVTGGFRILMNTIMGKTVYPTLDAAKTRVFRFIETGEADGYFSKKA